MNSEEEVELRNNYWESYVQGKRATSRALLGIVAITGSYAIPENPTGARLFGAGVAGVGGYLVATGIYRKVGSFKNEMKFGKQMTAEGVPFIVEEKKS